MKKILVYPCGTEIGLEIYRSLCFSTRYELYGGSCSYDHGRFVYDKHIDNLPFITDASTPEDIDDFSSAIRGYGFDFIYPAMDGVINIFAKYRRHLRPVLIAPEYGTTSITRSKRKTYELLKDVIPVPEVFRDAASVADLPVFVKPDAGQGSVGARKISSRSELASVDFQKFVCLEYLPGIEYTVDCFTNSDGKLLYARGRERRRIKNGISVNTIFADNSLFADYAERINSMLEQKGGWFFQLKQARDGTLKLLEAASRIAGTSAVSRAAGVNLPLLTVSLFDGQEIGYVMPNNYSVELDRALGNKFKLDIAYRTVYIDYDDTIVGRNGINTKVVQFLYQCLNHGIKLVLLSRHDGDLMNELHKHRLSGLFDDIFHLGRGQHKHDYITDKEAIFVDDSFQERRAVKDNCGLPVFDTHMLEALIEE